MKKVVALALGSLVLSSCSTSMLEKFVGAPTYTATVISPHVSDDNVTLYKVTLDKFSLYNYYIEVTDTEHQSTYMTVRYDKEEKKTWTIDDKEVTNHGYIFVGWKTEMSTSEISSSVITVE